VPDCDGMFLDMYGTLAAGDRAAVEAVCARVLADVGLDLTPRELSLTWGDRFFHAMEATADDGFATLHALEQRTLRETMARLGTPVDPDPYVADLVAYWRRPPLHAETREFLRTAPVPVCIVSNADTADLLAALEHHRVVVDAVITSEMTRSYKPEVAIFAEALRQTGWSRERVWHVGDSLHSDVGGAHAAGLRSIWINRAHRIHDIGDVEQLRPDHEVDDLRSIWRLPAFQ
jgi:2-haloacid dehalogenase